MPKRGTNRGSWLEVLLGPIAVVLVSEWASWSVPDFGRPILPLLAAALFGYRNPGWRAWIGVALTTGLVSLRPFMGPTVPSPAAVYVLHTALWAVVVVLFLALVHRVRRNQEAIARKSETEAGRLGSLMAYSPEGLWRTDADGVTLEVNRSMAQMIGCHPAEMTGRSFREFLTDESRDTAMVAFERVVRGESMTFQTRLRSRTGEVFNVVVSTHPVMDRDRKLVEAFAIIRDVTAQAQVDTERHVALSLLEAALESTADGILVVDTEGRIVRFNERFVRLWGIPSEILQSRDDRRAIEFVLSQLEEPDKFLSKVEKLYATPEAESFDTLRFLDGRVFERYSLPQRLDGEVVGRVWSFRDVTDREHALTEQRLSAEREASIAQNLDAALFTFALDADGRILRYEYVSRGAEAVYGIPTQILENDPGFWLRRFHPDDAKNIGIPALQKLRQLQTATIEYRYETSRGIWRWHRSRLMPRMEADGVVRVDGIETDVTDRVALEEQFRHAQKMEAVGQLAGGVAHDFNNILTAVLGYADLLLSRIQKNDPSRRAIEEIRKGGERAASLTRQLLAFSRRATTQPRAVDLNAAINNLEPMVRRLIDETIRFDLALAGGIGTVRVDPAQLEQVLVNLVVNARDAMPEGGTISIRTDRVVLGAEEAAATPGLVPGPYLRVVISDTGPGIPAPLLERIFEPFFTTKEPGRGTGLGLATVYGIVRQHGGRVTASSGEPGGAVFEVLLPAVEEAAAPTPPESTGLPSGSETVLVVEDDASLLTLARDSLTELGYRVLTASSGRAALEVLEGEGGQVKILVTDVVMPEMGGFELAKRSRGCVPGLPVLFVSGYTKEQSFAPGHERERLHFLEKPYTPLSFARKIREILDLADRSAPEQSGKSAARAVGSAG